MEINGYNPDMLLAHIRQDTRFDADLLETWLKDITALYASGLTPDDLPRAAAALREKQEREKGCEFCTGDINTRTNILDCECGEVYIDAAGRLTAGDDDVKVRFCPMCGRPLAEK